MLNLSITAALVLVIVLGGILLRENQSKAVSAAGAHGKSTPAAGTAPKDSVEHFQILPSPALVESRANEGDTLRIRYGNEEHIFVLYFADALETTMNHPQLVAEQGRYFGKAADKVILETGNEAAAYVAQLLKERPFDVLTKWERVPNTVRYYAIIKVHLPEGPVYLADLLISKGFAWVHGIPTDLPDDKRDLPTYVVELSTLARKARESQAGIWEHLAK
jgi:hypothetical protein